MALTPVQQTKADVHTDEELVARARARDEAAVRAITTRYNRRLFRVARSILRDDAEAEDVVQETYVRAFTGLDMFRGDAAFGTWITRIAMNEALGRLRKRRPTVDWETYVETRPQAQIIDFPVSAASNDPEKTMAQGEIRVVLEKAIDQLPDSFRAVFVARIVEAMTVEETADLFGLKSETVKTRLHRARTLLLRLSASASIPKCVEWAEAYFRDFPQTGVELILLYQAVPATDLTSDTTAITHFFAPVQGRGFTRWQGGHAARRFAISTLVGRIAQHHRDSLLGLCVLAADA